MTLTTESHLAEYLLDEYAAVIEGSRRAGKAALEVPSAEGFLGVPLDRLASADA